MATQVRLTLAKAIAMAKPRRAGSGKKTITMNLLAGLNSWRDRYVRSIRVISH